jgi:hypothetical protein
VWIFLSVDDDKGGKWIGRLRAGRPGQLVPLGWSKSSLKPGDVITVDFSPAKDGSRTGLSRAVRLADGSCARQAAGGSVGTDQEDIVSKSIALLSAAFMCALPRSRRHRFARRRQHPDFTGVYYPINPFGNVGRGSAAAPPPAAGTPRRGRTAAASGAGARWTRRVVRTTHRS